MYLFFSKQAGLRALISGTSCGSALALTGNALSTPSHLSRNALYARLYPECIFRLIVQFAVNLGDLPAPALTLPVAKCSYLIMRPVHIVTDKSNLLVNPIRRVRCYTPASRKFTGISIFCPQCGHTDL